MAYAALSSLKHTLQQLLQTKSPLICGSSIQQQHVESTYQSLCGLQAFLEDATKEFKDIDTLKVLEKKVRDVVHRVEDTVDSSLRSVILARSFSEVLQEMACDFFNEKFQKVEKEVDSLWKEVMGIKFNKRGSRCAEARTSSSSRVYPTKHNVVVGMEDDFNTILDRLTTHTNELTVISLVGMGGIGKSTLARKVYDDPSIRHRFDTCAWVTISEEFNERQMLLERVSSISPGRSNQRYQEMSNDQLMEIAYKGLMGRRFLIVIDDLWSSEDWDQMQRIFPNDNKRSRILLTTRLKYVADYVSPDIPPHNMSFLSLDDSWNLFTERLFKEESCPPHLEEIGKHIIQQCRGLPLSIVVIVGLLRKMDPTHDNWKKVEENLNSFFSTVSEQCQSILSLRYMYLPQHLKACFLYVGGFPEDMEIIASRLISLWIAEQFIKERSYKRVEVVAEEYLEELIDRSLIFVGKRRANGSIKTCKIHDLLRQFCVREAQNENVVHVVNENVPIFSEAITCQRRLMIPLQKRVDISSYGIGVTSITRSFVFKGFCYRRDTLPVDRFCYIVSQFRLLKVLDVLSTDHCFSSVIPQLVHLRYVAAKIDKAPSLAKLWNIQTIILDGLGIRQLKLPLEIWTMSEIRQLDMNWSVHMPNPVEAESHSIGEQLLFLNNLQKLALPCSPFMAEIIRTPNLKKLKIIGTYVASDWSAFLECLINLRGLETLNMEALVGWIPLILPRDFCPPKLKQLRLAFTSLPWETMVVLANLPNLEVLKTHSAFYGTDWRLNEDVVFQRLKYLRLACEDLERWEAASDNFPMLEQLVLFDLHKLEEIPQSIGEIMILKLIKIEYCSSAVETSAKQIQEEQESWGNYELQVRITRKTGLENNF